MRRSLMNTFDEISILDLHGNSKKKEKAPNGKDENVFDITQGVAICLMVKRTVPKAEKKVYHTDFFGTRSQKYTLYLPRS